VTLFALLDSDGVGVCVPRGGRSDGGEAGAGGVSRE